MSQGRKIDKVGLPSFLEFVHRWSSSMSRQNHSRSYYMGTQNASRQPGLSNGFMWHLTLPVPDLWAPVAVGVKELSATAPHCSPWCSPRTLRKTWGSPPKKNFIKRKRGKRMERSDGDTRLSGFESWCCYFLFVEINFFNLVFFFLVIPCDI